MCSIGSYNAAVIGVDSADTAGFADDDVVKTAGFEGLLFEVESPIQTVAVGNAQGSASVFLIGGHHGDHLTQGLLYGEGLTPLADLTLRGGAHEQLDLQRVRHNGLKSGKPAVFAQVVQILQDKEGFHLADIAGGAPTTVSKSLPEEASS